VGFDDLAECPEGDSVVELPDSVVIVRDDGSYVVEPKTAIQTKDVDPRMVREGRVVRGHMRQRTAGSWTLEVSGGFDTPAAG
jgi:hypothetical protein